MVEIVLLAAFAASLLIIKAVTRKWNFPLSGRIAMCAMLFFTALGHVMFPTGMAMMIPPFIPFRLELVYFTGLLEVAGGIGLLLPKFRRISAILLITFFVLITPANIYAAMHHIDLQKASYDGNGPAYLWFRLPLQLFFIAWVWYFGLRKP
jgi:uncharacterized membrane protein